jgi:hypothetical protein
MKLNRSNLLILFILILACALYRVWDSRPMGFAPQIAMALFAGSVSKDKRFAFLFPILSLFISDLIYQLLYIQGPVNYQRILFRSVAKLFIDRLHYNYRVLY